MISFTHARRICLPFPAALIFLAFPFLLAAQESSQSQVSRANQVSAQSQASPEFGGVVFRSNVRQVVVDVVVKDSSDKPVQGLTRDDFLIAEDGRPQRVLSFDVHDLDSAPDTLPDAPPLPSNTWMNVPEAPDRGPLYVILYDMLNMDMDDQAAARKQLLRFISAKPAGARFAIFVLSDGLRLVQGFTDDRYQLFAAMDPKAPRPHVPKIFLHGENYGKGQVRVIVSAFNRIAHFLDGLPERKNVIWLTGSVTTTILPGANSGSETEAMSYSDEIKQAVDAMARSQVAVYPVDVRGVVITHAQARANVGKSGSAMATRNDSSILNNSYAAESDIAVATGGEARQSSNDLSAQLAEVVEAGANYYTLSYSPSNQNYDGKLRKIHVELSKRGYRLEYRRSYYAGRGGSGAQDERAVSAGERGQRLGEMPVDSLIAHMRHGAPLAHQLLFTTHVRAVGEPAKATPEQMAALARRQPYSHTGENSRLPKPVPPVPLQAYAIDYTVSDEQVTPTLALRDKQPFLLEIAVAFFDAEGQILTSKVEHSRDGNSSTPPKRAEAVSSVLGDTGQKSFYRARQQIDVPLNAASIRVAVRDLSTDRIGAMEVSLPLAPDPRAQADAPIRSADHASTNPN